MNRAVKLSVRSKDQLAKFDGRIVDLFGDSGGNVGVNTMNSSNKRRHERYTVSVAAWIEFYGDTETRGSVSRDISIEGARFSSVRPTLVGEPVLVRIQLGRTMPMIECKGRIVWTRQMQNRLHDFAVRFVDLSDHERSELHKFIMGRMQKPEYAAV